MTEYAVEVGLFGALCDKENWDRYSALVQPDALTPDTAILFETMGMLHEKGLEVTASRLYECSISHPQGKKHRDLLRAAAELICNAEDVDVEEAVARFRKEVRAMRLMAAVENSLSNANENDLQQDIQDILADFAQNDLSDPFESLRKDWKLSVALEERKAAGGELAWPWDEMNRDCGKLSPAEMCIIAGFVNSGKSSFVTHLCAFWLAKILPPDQGVIFFNNEDPFVKVLGRFYTVLTEKPLSVLSENIAAADAAFDKMILKGNPNRLWVVDKHDLTTGFMQAAVQDYVSRGGKPAAIVIQDIDHCAMSREIPQKAGSYGPIYAWARGLAKQFNTRVICVSQMKGTEEYNPYPSLSEALAWSKSDKQASADMVLTIGKSDDSYMRHIGCPKSKAGPEWRPDDPPQDHLKMPLRLDKWTGRFHELPNHERIAVSETTADTSNKKSKGYDNEQPY